MIEWWFGKEWAGEFNHWTFVWLNRPAMIEWVLAVLVAVAFVVLSWMSMRRLAVRPLRWTLLGLRILFLLGIVALWWQPAIQLQKVVYKKSHAAVVADQSRSMSLKAGNGRTRAESLRNWFDENANIVTGLKERHHLRAFRFDEVPHAVPVADLAEKAPDRGRFTNLADALEGALEGVNEDETAGMWLFSDGVANPSEEAADLDVVLEKLKSHGVIVHTIGVGGEGAVADIAIRDVRYDGFAFVHNKLTIEASISSRGIPERPVQVSLSREGQPVATQQAVLPAEGTAVVSFTFTPTRVGRFVYSVEVPPAPDDAIAANNRRDFIIDVIRDKIRVLHVCGHPDYDEMFLRRYLKNNPNVDLISFFILRTNSDLQLVSERELSLIPFPTDELFDKQLHTFDLIVFQNFTYRGYQMRQYLSNIRRYVLEGGAFLVVGGDLSYSLGGYGGTEIEDILPFDIVTASPEFDAAPFTLALTEAGRRHPVMQAFADTDKPRDLLGLNLGLIPRPGSLVLAEHPTRRTAAGAAPVAAVIEPGKGRVLALSVDSTWRWHFGDVAQGGEGALYNGFYGNALRWLIRDPELRHLSVRSDRDTLPPGEKARLDLRVTDEAFKPKPGAQVAVRISRRDDGLRLHEETLRTDDDGVAVVGFDAPEEAGPLMVELEQLRSDGTPGEKQTLLLFVGDTGKELDDVQVDFARLRNIAETTGGLFTPLDQLGGELPAFERQQVMRVGKKRDVPLWDHAGVLVLLVLLIVVEWWWRKRRRLN